jgi:type IV secretion system protein VirD4
MMSVDELELDTLGGYIKTNPKTGKQTVIKQKSALFVIISDTDSSFNFIVALMYSQLFNLLCDRADNDFDGRLPVHVRCLLDEFANIGTIPNFEKLIATIRSREISACVVLQAQSQLKAIYKDNMDTIIGNMDTTLFLGGKEKTTLEEISKMLGKETIDMYNTSVTKGTQESHGQNYQKLGKELMTVDEIAVMDGGKCILQVRGERPFISRKYDITQHKNYKYLADSSKKNIFDVEKHLSTNLKLKEDDVYDVFEIDLSEASTA